ncbi:hypothetical protein GHK86_19710 [Acidimicrobiaceae bacterium USS-CC1]|uniref:IPT/TIG domain-containing protein n=1 Tax=Acidiferrimicrobium australe TaxID=2664430 RepID=A0ABW9QZG0_9ACTN|nr:hypothetical protein [Acidiferrimicrobium australe]
MSSGVVQVGPGPIGSGARAAAAGAVTVTVNGAPLKGGGAGSTLLAGCSIDVGVSGLGAGAHRVGVTVSATEPSGSGAVVSVDEPEVTGAFDTGSRNLSTVLTGGFRRSGNGYHLRVTAAVDGVTIASAPYWLACGAVQHAGHAVQIALSVEWVDRAGKALAGPPKGIAKSYRLDATSSQGSGRCAYTARELVCRYRATTEDSTADAAAPPLGVRVSGLGTYVVVEHGLPSQWSPSLATVGQFAADPTIRQWWAVGEDAGVAPLVRGPSESGGGPPLIAHVVVNRQLP